MATTARREFLFDMVGESFLRAEPVLGLGQPLGRRSRRERAPRAVTGTSYMRPVASLSLCPHPLPRPRRWMRDHMRIPGLDSQAMAPAFEQLFATGGANELEP